MPPLWYNYQNVNDTPYYSMDTKKNNGVILIPLFINLIQNKSMCFSVKVIFIKLPPNLNYYNSYYTIIQNILFFIVLQLLNKRSLMKGLA